MPLSFSVMFHFLTIPNSLFFTWLNAHCDGRICLIFLYYQSQCVSFPHYFHNQHTIAVNITFFTTTLKRQPKQQLPIKNQNRTLWGFISECKMIFLKYSCRYTNCNCIQLSRTQLVVMALIDILIK